MAATGMTPPASDAVASAPSFRATLVPRVLGIYIAGCAGAIQVLDIAVDRLGLDDRTFTFAIVLAVVGIPFAGTGAALFDTARAERRPPPRPAHSLTREPAPIHSLPVTREPDGPSPASDLPRRMELALSYRRIAELHSATGSHAEAEAQRTRANEEILRIIGELEGML